MIAIFMLGFDDNEYARAEDAIMDTSKRYNKSKKAIETFLFRIHSDVTGFITGETTFHKTATKACHIRSYEPGAQGLCLKVEYVLRNLFPDILVIL